MQATQRTKKRCVTFVFNSHTIVLQGLGAPVGSVVAGDKEFIAR